MISLKRFNFVCSELLSQSNSTEFALPASSSNTDNIEKTKLPLIKLIDEFRGRSRQSGEVNCDNVLAFWATQRQEYSNNNNNNNNKIIK